ncbi:MAG TPA: DUF4395 domain-containing protein [Thermodesulfobacteriota bacterium]|nr:DUF4395 domain-containing protein [Thermodesulfobacteriota bacterium]HNU71797.1 DUF4395 domain-containing protein [Thermodesulfobacteriota bacterium]HOC38507.1 DUF4395 domain-containing protein [Thermodesulfobacteriota bacterium]HQO77613.1 DUF4395 domain-containing protein [Thermodesulfobacteriota bacterium]
MIDNGISNSNESSPPDGIPMPIVKLTRWVILMGVGLGLIFQQPLLTTVLFLVLLPAVLLGRRGSLIVFFGKRLFSKKKLAAAEREDARLARFNNTIATVLLGTAQIAFFLDADSIGWIFSGMVALAAAVALAGFCVGCYFYFQYKMQRYRLLELLTRKG